MPESLHDKIVALVYDAAVDAHKSASFYQKVNDVANETAVLIETAIKERINEIWE